MSLDKVDRDDQVDATTISRKILLNSGGTRALR
jgi:hypothetical protein